MLLTKKRHASTIIPASISIVWGIVMSGCGETPSDMLADEESTGGSVGSAGASAYDPEPCPDSDVGFASEVHSFEFGEGANFGQENFPEAVLHGPEGGGCCQGSLQVVSLGDGGYVVLGFGERTIIDGPGADFAIFENAFLAGGEDGEPFTELAVVAVSVDGEQWVSFPCEPENVVTSHCAGVEPVLANVVTGEGDAFDSAESGGDLFDLADVGMEEARYVRVTDIAGDGAVFDLDAAAIFHGRCE